LIKREARRKRIILSQSQKDALCAWFEKNPYPDIVTREYLANRIGISESQILVGIKFLFGFYSSTGGNGKSQAKHL
jgi:hypothetical protein